MSDNGRHQFDPTPEGRVAYLESLLDPFEPWIDHGPVFVEHLDDEDPRVREIALRGLWYSPDASLIERLIEMAENDPSLQVRAAAISGLGIYIYEGEMADYDFDFGPMTELVREDELPEAEFERVKAFLLGLHADEARSLDERRRALEALSFLSDPKVADLIEAAYNRPEPEMKITALFAMGRSGMTRWTDILARELFNAEHDIQREAIRAVGEIGLTELGKDVWRLTYADDREIMLEAIEALGQTGWEGAFERLDELALHPDSEIAGTAEEALAEWHLMSEILNEDDELGPDFDLDWGELD
jgi:HEAT repeat protein